MNILYRTSFFFALLLLSLGCRTPYFSFVPPGEREIFFSQVHSVYKVESQIFKVLVCTKNPDEVEVFTLEFAAGPDEDRERVYFDVSHNGTNSVSFKFVSSSWFRPKKVLKGFEAHLNSPNQFIIGELPTSPTPQVARK